MNIIQLMIRIGLIIFSIVYIVVAITAYRQMSKLEGWLTSLKRYPLKKIAKIHLVMAIIGFVLALLIFI